MSTVLGEATRVRVLNGRLMLAGVCPISVM